MGTNTSNIKTCTSKWEQNTGDIKSSEWEQTPVTLQQVKIQFIWSWFLMNKAIHQYIIYILPNQYYHVIMYQEFLWRNPLSQMHLPDI